MTLAFEVMLDYDTTVDSKPDMQIFAVYIKADKRTVYSVPYAAALVFLGLEG